MMRNDALQLGHLNSAIDQHAERPKSPTGFIDYRAPEMITLKSQLESELVFTRATRLLQRQQEQGQQPADGPQQHELESIQEGPGEGWQGRSAPVVPRLPLGRPPARASSPTPGQQPQPGPSNTSPRSARYLAQAAAAAAAAGATSGGSQQQQQQREEEAREGFASLANVPSRQASHQQVPAQQQPPGGQLGQAQPQPPSGARSSVNLTPRQQVKASPRGATEPATVQRPSSAGLSGFRRWATQSASQLLQGIVGSFRCAARLCRLQPVPVAQPRRALPLAAGSTSCSRPWPPALAGAGAAASRWAAPTWRSSCRLRCARRPGSARTTTTRRWTSGSWAAWCTSCSAAACPSR
jgi:hypothetical protein